MSWSFIMNCIWTIFQITGFLVSIQFKERAIVVVGDHSTQRSYRLFRRL